MKNEKNSKKSIKIFAIITISIVVCTSVLFLLKENNSDEYNIYETTDIKYSFCRGWFFKERNDIEL